MAAERLKRQLWDVVGTTRNANRLVSPGGANRAGRECPVAWFFMRLVCSRAGLAGRGGSARLPGCGRTHIARDHARLMCMMDGTL